MSQRTKRTFLWILIPILIVASLGFLFLQYFFDPAFYKRILQDSLTQTLGREVSIGEARISLWGGVGVTFEDFRIQDRSQTFDLIHSKRLYLKAKLLPLLRKEVQWKRIILEEPTFRLLRDSKGQFNFVDGPLTGEGLKESHKRLIQTLSTLFGGSFTLKEGRLIFTDRNLDELDLRTEIRSLNLQISKVSYRDPFPFRLSGKLVDPKREGLFSITGTLQNIPEDLDLSKGKIQMRVDIKEIDTSHFWPYLKQWLPMKTLAGTFDLTCQYQGDFTGVFKTTAKMSLKEVVFDWPQVFSYVHTPRWVNLSLDADSNQKEIKIPHLLIELPEIWVKSKGKIYGIGTKEMGMEAEAQSGPFDIADGKRLIPYRVITPDVSNALFRAEGNGPVQILSVKLSGKMPEIDHCDELQNAHVLSVEMKLNGIRMKLPWDLPALEGLKGQLIFSHGHLNLNQVEGRFFHSTLENVRGVFYELLQAPTLQIESEGRFNLMDLPSLAKVEIFPQDVSEALSAFQIQSGRANYRISAKGVIKPPLRFRHQGSYLLSHARFTHRRIPFPIQITEGRVDLSNEDLKWSEAKVDFGQSSLLLNGSWKHGEKTSSLETLVKGRIDLKNLLSLSQVPVFPEELRSKAKEIETLSGTGQISFKLKSLSSPSHVSYEGEFLPREASVRRKGMPFPLVFKEGTLSFSSRGFSFSKMRVQLLNSFLFLDGYLREGKVRLSTRGSFDLKDLPSLFQLPFFPDSVRSKVNDFRDMKGEAEVSMRWQGETEDGMNALKQGQIKLKGVSFSYQMVPLPLSQIEGSILFSPEQFRVQTVKGKIGENQITVSGTIPRTLSSLKTIPVMKRPISFQIASPLLDLDLFFPKKTDSTPTSFEGFRELLSNWKVEGTVDADQVRYQGLFYQELKIEMKTIDEKLHIYPFQFKGAGGDFWGEGWFQPAEKGIRFEIKPRVSNMEAGAFMRIISSRAREERVIYTGRFHVDKVELQGEGEDFQKVKKSLNGSLRLALENGAIEKNNILSKIFSILNVSQYFKGRVPDLKTKGLPFHRIIAHFQIKEGVATTEDFLVDSDAMRITGIGTVDLGKNEVDAKIGVHPLVTVDTVLSKIPVAGYILTGKDKAFLSFVYEVKGDLDDPKIEAIPIKSMGEGVFGIIKRVLETPIRPFQKPSHSSKEENN
ncbi:MAG: hypothetical protein A2156_10925 [Deltaproteobacteria bacterium RBG_16_48_10]|nr:MAG: hypothetical protein A2156_10925 [Deltaproteobacteria bacterium RBG_16_48_10]